MSESTFIKKRQKARNKPFLTIRIIMGLVFLSGIIWAGFYVEYGSIGDINCDGNCENLHSLSAWVIGFFMIFGAIIALGAAVGALFAVLRWNRSRSSGLSSILEDAEK